MQLNCKVIKKWQPPHFYINPHSFQGYPPLVAKFLVSPPPPLTQVTQFLEGPTSPLIRGGGSHYDCFQKILGTLKPFTPIKD